MEISYVQLNIGCLSRNFFWGESASTPRRLAKCSSVLICRENEYILVDPGVPYDEMRELLDCRCGIDIANVHMIFFTHLHGDHRVDALKYKGARLIASETAIQEQWEKTGTDEFTRYLESVGEELRSGIKTVPLPGHTRGNTGLTFETRDGKVLIAGDAVMTRDFFDNNMGYFNSWDQMKAEMTIQYIRDNYQIIVPGHDIAFYNKK